MKAELIKADGRVFEVDCKIEQKYLHPMYSLIEEVGTLNPKNGLLKIFTLKPISDNDPLFVARWDGGSREHEKTERTDLDIDIDGVSPKQKNWFKREQKGYSGHHSIRASDKNQWEYDVIIAVPEKKIFEGCICLHLHRRIKFEEVL